MAITPKTARIHPPTSQPLLARAIAFLVVFVLLSGVIGSHIIANGLVNKHGFQIYGGAGKALLFGLIAFLLLAKRQAAAPTLRPWHLSNSIWLILSGVAATAAWLGTEKLISGSSDIAWPLFTHTAIIASIIFAAGGIFGPSNLRQIGKTYRRELLASLALSVAFFVFLYVVYALWKPLAIVVLHVVRWLLDLVGLQVTVLPPRTLLLDKFGITIAQYCSGIESIALFTALYGLIGVLDWPRFNHRRYLYAFLPALILLFVFNILRVFILILAGYYINPEIAFSLFHSYAGMIFFIIYSILFWAVGYKWMLNKPS